MPDTLQPRGIVVTVPPLPGIPAPTPTKGVVNTSGKAASGFDLNGLIDGVLGIAGKFFDYKTAQVNSSGTGSITYEPTTPAPVTTGGGFDLSNPIVLVALAGGVYLLTKGSNKE